MIFVVIISIYVGLIGVFSIGWLRLPRFSGGKKKPIPPLSLVICGKNEAANLPALFESILAQTHPDFEVIFANDHSTDETAKILDKIEEKHHFFRSFIPQKTGKKNALREAVALAKNELIVCTDADCVLQPQHLEIVANYFAKHETDLLLGGVKLSVESGFFSKLQALEFASLVATTAGACGVQQPIMCNGANLAFRKSVFAELSDKLHDNEPSGDDQFLLFAAKKSGKKIDFVRHRACIVGTKAQRSLHDFFAQRARWTSKTKSYTDWFTIFVAISVFSATIVELILPILSGFFPEFWAIFGVVFGLKFVADFTILALFLPFVGQTKLLIFTPILAVIYPFYVLASVILGLSRPVKWKQ